MNRDDIIRMMREAHLDVYGLGKDHQQFMAAVECVAYSAFTAGALAEREACARVCDEKVAAEYATGKVDHNEMGWTQACAIAIRARGQE